jgi:hypothetical protein
MIILSNGNGYLISDVIAAPPESERFSSCPFGILLLRDSTRKQHNLPLAFDLDLLLCLAGTVSGNLDVETINCVSVKALQIPVQGVTA